MSKIRHIFADFLRSARRLWLEMMGALFLALAVIFSLNTVTEFRKAAEPISSWDFHTGFSVLGSAFFAVLTLLFSLESFWKARKLP